jgi:hypothetical protein
MPSDLADVLHYFIPEVERDGASVPLQAQPSGQPESTRPAALPLISVPISEHDVVRAAFVWNLVVEIARMGARAAVVAPAGDESSPLWPDDALGGIGAEIVRSPARDLGALYRDALDVAVDRAADADDGGVVFVRVPPGWLRNPAEGASLLRWSLLFTSSEPRDLLETYGITKLLSAANEDARVGVTVHGARRMSEAEEAFAQLTKTTAARLGRPLTSYGLLVDDLHVYRAIVSQRPIGLVHPQSPAALSLRDVAEFVLEDARKIALF